MSDFEIKEIPKGYKVKSLPDGYKVIEHQGRSFVIPENYKVRNKNLSDELQQGLRNTKDMAQSSISSLGSLANASLANLNELFGVDSSLFRENQDWWNSRKQNAENRLEQDYGKDSIVKTIGTEGFNPVNYLSGGTTGAGALTGLLLPMAVGSLGDISSQGKRTSSYIDDVTKVVGDTALGSLFGKFFDAPMRYSPRANILSDSKQTKQGLEQFKKFEKEYDIQLPLSTKLKSSRLGSLEESMENQPFSFGFRDFSEPEAARMSEIVSDRLPKHGAVDNKSVAGEQFKDFVQDSVIKKKDEFKGRYNDFYDQFGDIKLNEIDNFSLDGTKQAISDIMAQLQNNPLANRSLLKELDALNAIDGDLTLKELKNIVSTVGSKANDKFVTGTADVGAWKHILNGMKKDFENISDDALMGIKNIDADYKNFKTAFETPQVRSILKDGSNPALIGSRLNQNTNYLKGLRDKEETLTPALTELFVKSKKADDMISPAKFNKEFTKEGLQDILSRTKTGQQAQAELQKFKQVFDAIMLKNKGRNYSNTARQQLYNNLLSSVPSMALALGKAPLDIAKRKIYTSKFFNDYVERGILDETTAKELQKLFNSVGSAGGNVGGNSLNELFDYK